MVKWLRKIAGKLDKAALPSSEAHNNPCVICLIPQWRGNWPHRQQEEGLLFPVSVKYIQPEIQGQTWTISTVFEPHDGTAKQSLLAILLMRTDICESGA
jgi:hypothetical protein